MNRKEIDWRINAARNKIATLQTLRNHYNDEIMDLERELKILEAKLEPYLVEEAL